MLALDFTRERQEAGDTATTKLQALTGSHTWLLREVDDLLFPSSGYQLSLQLGGGSRAMLSERDFLRGHGRIAWFRPVGSRGSLILRGELGAIWAASREGIPNDLLFRAGGDQSVRGYGYQTLGVSKGGAVVGGRYLTVASTEYVHSFQPKWGVALFVDASDAADAPGDLDLKLGVWSGPALEDPGRAPEPGRRTRRGDGRGAAAFRRQPELLSHTAGGLVIRGLGPAAHRAGIARRQPLGPAP